MSLNAIILSSFTALQVLQSETIGQDLRDHRDLSPDLWCWDADGIFQVPQVLAFAGQQHLDLSYCFVLYYVKPEIP